MIENYFPNAEDFDEMADHLASIAYALGRQVDVSDWRGVQDAVKKGLAPTIFPIGTQLMVNHSTYGDVPYTVVAHNHFKNAQSKDAPTMTLMCQKVLLPSNLSSSYAPVPVSYDAPEAFYRAEKELRDEIYNVTVPYTVGELEAGTYNFSLVDSDMQAYPIGTRLCLTTIADGSPIVELYHYESNSYLGDAHLTKGDKGISLGTFGVELNHLHRVLYGSNNYSESAIRHYLNNEAAKPTKHILHGEYDVPAGWINTNDGFIYGLDSGLRDSIVEVIVPCTTNDTFESPNSDTVVGEPYTLVDKVFLPSATELGYNVGNSATNSAVLPYFKNATNEVRIRYYNDVPRRYWTRTPENRNAFGVVCAGIDGAMTNIQASNSSGIVPMFNIG